jgi:hypothetical protein
MKTTPKPQPQKVQPDTAPQNPDLAAQVADLRELTMQLTLRSVEHSNNFATHSGWFAEHELRLRKLDGATKEAAAQPANDEAARNTRALTDAIERLSKNIGGAVDHGLNKIAVRLDQ